MLGGIRFARGRGFVRNSVYLFKKYSKLRRKEGPYAI